MVKKTLKRKLKLGDVEILETGEKIQHIIEEVEER